jgi:hypothetical protein
VYGVSLRVVVSKKSWCQKNRGVKNRGVMKYPLGHEIPDPKKPQKIPDPRARARRDIPFLFLGHHVSEPSPSRHLTLAVAHRVMRSRLRWQQKSDWPRKYDAAQSGEVATQSHGGANIPNGVPSKNTVATVSDIGLTRKQIHEARQLRDTADASKGVMNIVTPSAN